MQNSFFIIFIILELMNAVYKNIYLPSDGGLAISMCDIVGENAIPPSPLEPKEAGEDGRSFDTSISV
jgi:hypothetical protein